MHNGDVSAGGYTGQSSRRMPSSPPDWPAWRRHRVGYETRSNPTTGMTRVVRSWYSANAGCSAAWAA